MRKTALASFVAVAALLITLVPVASAAKLSTAEGAPNDTDTSPTGYYLFHSDDTFRLHTHGPGAQHDFDAVLHSRSGTFDNVTPMHLEADDRADITDGGHTLVLHFHTFGATDGVDFTIKGAEKMRLDLKLDDKPIDTSSIFIGPKGKHPEHNPFTIKF